MFQDFLGSKLPDFRIAAGIHQIRAKDRDRDFNRVRAFLIPAHLADRLLIDLLLQV